MTDPGQTGGRTKHVVEFRGVVDVQLARWDADSALRIANEIAGVVSSSITDEALARWLELAGCYVIL